ncbi:MAG: DUF2341 domain-containing protein, partial [Deltaproteobacteria bacterium]|nr:DUF2341 domain-containing protein [Deltaproteobacteria bacterium]
NFIRAAQGGVNCLAGGASMGTVLSLQQNDIIRLVQQNEGGDSTAVFEANRVALQATRISSLFSSSAGYLTVSGAASMNAGDSNELTITAYTSEGAVDTAYSGDKTLTFSGPSTAPNGSVPTVESVNVGTAITVSFTSGVSDAGAATLLAGKAEFNNVDTTDGTITTTGSSARDLDLTVSHGSVEHFTYLQQPNNSRPNDSLTGIILELLDTYNNRCTNASSSVTLSIGTNPVAGTLSGTTIQTPASGTVLFDDLSIDSLGSGYTLQASTSGATTATSDSFSITSDAPSSFGYRKLITIDYTRIGSSCASSLSNFPLLVSLAADNNLKSVVNGGHVENNEGRDIIFRQDDGIVELDHEIESYNPVSGDLDAWVRIPDLAHNQNTSIYIYYGNSDVTESTQNAATVWDANHAGVWHLDESGSGQNNEFTDSTANDNSGQGGGGNSVLVPTQTSGAVDDGQDFDGTGDYIDCGSGTSLDLKASSMTAECWLKYDSPPSSRMCVFSKGGETDGYRIFLEIDGTISFDLTGQTYSLSSAAALTQGSWQHVAARYNGSDMRLWLNGTLDSNRLNRPPSINSSTASLLIGRDAAGSSPFNGGIDELRISGSARTSCWIETAYNSQSSPGTFCTIGAEEAGPPTAIKLNSFTAEPYQGLVVLTWETGHEIETAGFHLYRISPEGLRHRITDSIIPAAISSVQGHEYNYYDEDAEPADRPCYLLEEITLAGSRSLYGPYCVSSAPLQNISDRAAFPAIAPSDDTATLRASASSAADAAALPSQAAIKIAVSTDGWYLIAQPELIAAGLTPSSNPRFFQLYADGKEIPIQVSGSIDGSFDPQDTIAFYGMALDTKYSDTQTYWLTEGSSSGKRIKCSFGLGFRPAPPAYPAILEHKE